MTAELELQKRARELAKPLEQKDDNEQRLEVVTFTLARESYALETAYVREVFPLREITPLPCTPPHIFGIVNVRGRIVPMVDLKTFFDLPDSGLTDLNKIIILQNYRSHDEMEFGVLADSIGGWRLLSLGELQPPLATLSGARAQYLRGLANVEGEPLIVLDAAKLLADERLIVNEQAE